jgi:hypothetical protein
VVGILPLDDVVRATGDRVGVPTRKVIETLQAICGAHHPPPHAVAV